MPLTKDEMLAKVEATKGITTDDKLNTIRVLWKKGRNMFASFLTEVGEVKKQIGDEKVFAEWCFWQLHIGVHAITDLACVLQQDDAAKVKDEFAAAKEAEKKAKDDGAHKAKLAKIAKQNEILEAQMKAAQTKAAIKKAEAEQVVEQEDENLKRAKAAWLEHPDWTMDDIRKVSHCDNGTVGVALKKLIAEGKIAAKPKTPRKTTPKTEMERYKVLVEAAKKAANHQWTLGDLAIQVTALKSYGEAKLAQFADDIGVEFSALENYRWVADKWPEKLNRLSNWTVAFVLAKHPDRVTLVAANPTMTVARAREIMDEHRSSKVVNFPGVA